MNKFTLNVYPLPDEWNGLKIQTDFHQILKILQMFGDSELLPNEKPFLLRKMFFIDKAPPPDEAYRAFSWFESMGLERDQNGDRVPDFDFEQDAPEIYASFWAVYRIDLFEPMHWWRFLPLLNGVTACPCALTDKIKLRHIDDSKGDTEAALQRAKRAAAIKSTHSRTETAFDAELRERLKSGKPLDDLLEVMKHGGG